MSDVKPCPECAGTGFSCLRNGTCPSGGDETWEDCLACAGQCVRCKGSGLVPVTDQDREGLGQLTFEGAL